MKSWHDYGDNNFPARYYQTRLLQVLNATATPFAGSSPRKRGWRGWLAWADRADPKSSRMRFDLASLLSYRWSLPPLKITTLPRLTSSTIQINHCPPPLRCKLFIRRFYDESTIILVHSRRSEATTRYSRIYNDCRECSSATIKRLADNADKFILRLQFDVVRSSNRSGNLLCGMQAVEMNVLEESWIVCM